MKFRRGDIVMYMFSTKALGVVTEVYSDEIWVVWGKEEFHTRYPTNTLAFLSVLCSPVGDIMDFLS